MTGAPPETPALRTARVRLLAQRSWSALAIAICARPAAAAAAAGRVVRRVPALSPAADRIDAGDDRRDRRKEPAHLGRWPWPRTMLARLIAFDQRVPARGDRHRHRDARARSAVTRARCSRNSAMDPALLAAIAALPSNDAELASAFSAAPIVVVLAGAAESVRRAATRARRCSSAMPPDSRRGPTRAGRRDAISRRVVQPRDAERCGVAAGA